MPDFGSSSAKAHGANYMDDSVMQTTARERKLRENDIERCPFLYSTASFSQTYSMEADDDPGPGTYDVTDASAALGPQFSSMKHTAPRVPILEKHESSWAKVFISRAASDAAGRAKETPGPGTYAVQVESIPATTGVRFGHAARPEPGYTSDGPGPIYDVRGNPREQGVSAFSASDRWASGPSDRSYLGPGEYGAGESFTGRMRKAKSFAEGRDKWEKVVFPGCEKVFLGRASLGPGKCHAFQTGGKTAPFCKAGREGPGGMWEGLKRKGEIPGPGAYKVGGPKHSIFNSKSAFNFGKPPPAARLNWKRQVYETASWSRLAMSKNEKSQARG
ncbi:unnamed protein product [Amoebophrya sp. A120]|nr:unnamed protein product [Amoebophrya sp. A120]|eukprot:GSA120T00003163001.1